MELFIDAYDWVMVPNVYGMALYAGGPGFVTKPCICGSNYIRKMSDFTKGPWCDLWDGLFWRFVARHQAFFSANSRLVFLTRQLERMDGDALARHREVASAFLERLR